MAYSTIRQKNGRCSHPGCSYYGPLTKGQCSNHYWLGIKLKSAEKFASKIVVDDDLEDLLVEADAVFSRYTRMRDANKDGVLHCFICNKPVRWQEAQLMHYIKRRASLFLRHDPRNCKSGCDECNCKKEGNYIEYAKRLEEQSPCITEILYIEGNLPYRPTREEIKNIITEYTQKIKSLQ